MFFLQKFASIVESKGESPRSVTLAINYKYFETESLSIFCYEGCSACIFFKTFFSWCRQTDICPTVYWRCLLYQDTAYRQYQASNISASFHKNLKQPQWDTQGPGGNWFNHSRKNQKSHILCQTHFNNRNAFRTTRHTVGPMWPFYKARKIAKFR